MTDNQGPPFQIDISPWWLIVHPRVWWLWFRRGLVSSKIMIVGSVAAGITGAALVLSGRPDAGLPLLLPIGVLIGLAVLAIFTSAAYAAARASGLAAWWQGVRARVVSVLWVGFWSVVSLWIIAALWPYLSLDPAKSWYALLNGVPADHVTIEREPHDCEFGTVPLGSKHCHYEARASVLKGAETEDGQPAVMVGYEKVED